MVTVELFGGPQDGRVVRAPLGTTVLRFPVLRDLKVTEDPTPFNDVFDKVIEYEVYPTLRGYRGFLR